VPWDVETLAKALREVFISVEYAKEHEPQRLDWPSAGRVLAAEYNRLAARSDPIVEVVGNGDGTMNVRTESGMRWRLTEAEYLAWPRPEPEGKRDA
jgi:hypothetical protein